MITCPICQATNFTSVISQPKVPACANVPLTTADFAHEVFGELEIVMCEGCSHIFNSKFDPEIINRMYSQNYSSGLPNSEGVRSAMRGIAETAIKPSNFAGQTVLEIGASDFAFSRLLLELGAKRIVAFEPSALFRVDDSRIRHVQGYFTAAAVTAEERAEVNMVVIRHVLEHVPKPVKFLEQLTDFMKPGARLYVEVPNVDSVLGDARVYDFFYEHLHYFSPALLQAVLVQLGFVIEGVSEHKGGQHFGVLCRKERPAASGLASFTMPPDRKRRDEIARLITSVADLKRALGEIIAAGGRTAIYGAGNHAIAVTVLLELSSAQIGCLFDLDDLKVGKFSPMSHIEIRKPSSETLAAFDTVVIIAALHQTEIHNQLRQRYGFRGKLVGTHPKVRVLD